MAGTTSPYKAEVLNPSALLQDQEVYKKLFYKHDEQKQMFDFLWANAPKEHTKRDEFTHWELPELLTVGEVDGAIAGTDQAGASATVTLTAGTHANNGKTSPFPVKTLVKVRTASSGEIGGRVVAKDTSVDGAHTITIQPAKSTVNLVGALAAGDKIIDISNAKGDGTGWVEALRRDPIAVTNKIQIFSAESTVFLGEAANYQKIEFDKPNGSGKSMLMYNQTEVDAFKQAKMKVGAQLAIGDYSEDYTDEDEGNPVSITKSLNEYITEEGGGLDVTYSGSDPVLTDFDAICDYMDVESCPERMMIFPGPKISRAYDRLFKGQFDNGEVDYTNWGVGSSKGRMVDFGFDGWRYGNREYLKKQNVQEFSYKGTYTTDSPWLETALFIPDGTKTDAKTNESIARMRIRYRKSDIENRVVKRIDRSPKELGVDQRKIAHQMECGLEVFGAHQFIKQSKG